MTTLSTWLCFLIPIALFLATGIYAHRRSRRLLRRWAAAQGYDVVAITLPPLIRPGPFFLRTKHGWNIVQLVVRTTGGRERLGWVRYPAGIVLFLSGEIRDVEIVWDDEWDRNRPLF